MSEEKNKKDKQNRILENIGIAHGNNEVVSRYGSATAEYIKGYSGVDNETGTKFNKSHKTIEQYKINPDYKEQNIRQQAGYSAEIIKTSRDNANNIINKQQVRVTRTDDHSDFGVNHTVYDHIEMLNGNVILGSGSQMKFVDDPKALIDKIATGNGGGKNDLSRYLDAKLDVPSDQFQDAKFSEYCQNRANELNRQADAVEQNGNSNEAAKLRAKANKLEKNKDIGLKQYCDDQAEKCRAQADRLEKEGKHDLAAKKRDEAKNYEQVKNNLRDSGIDSKTAKFYRKYPKIATAVDMVKTSHQGGVEAAKYGLMIGGGISTVKNFVAVMQDNKDLSAALYDITCDTGKSVMVGYGTGFTGSLIKSGMQQSTSKTMQQLAKTSFPTLVLSTTLALGDSIKRYAKGEIDEVQFMEEIGEKGSGMLASGLMATIGQIAIPIPIIGGVVGGMVGYSISSLFYKSSLEAFKEAKEAEDNYRLIKEQCEEARRHMLSYQLELQALFDEHMSNVKLELHECLSSMHQSSTDSDMNEFVNAANSLGQLIGKTLQFRNIQEFNTFMESDETLTI